MAWRDEGGQAILRLRSFHPKQTLRRKPGNSSGRAISDWLHCLTTSFHCDNTVSLESAPKQFFAGRDALSGITADLKAWLADAEAHKVAVTPGLELAAVVTRDPERRAQLRAAHPGAAALDTPEALLGMRRGIDLVVVCTPNRTHAPLARPTREAGLPVVVDRPFATSAAAAREPAAVARARGLLLTVFQNPTGTGTSSRCGGSSRMGR